MFRNTVLLLFALQNGSGEANGAADIISIAKQAVALGTDACLIDPEACPGALAIDAGAVAAIGVATLWNEFFGSTPPPSEAEQQKCLVVLESEVVGLKDQVGMISLEVQKWNKLISAKTWNDLHASVKKVITQADTFQGSLSKAITVFENDVTSPASTLRPHWLLLALPFMKFDNKLVLPVSVLFLATTVNAHCALPAGAILKDLQSMKSDLTLVRSDLVAMEDCFVVAPDGLSYNMICANSTLNGYSEEVGTYFSKAASSLKHMLTKLKSMETTEMSSLMLASGAIAPATSLVASCGVEKSMNLLTTTKKEFLSISDPGSYSGVNHDTVTHREIACVVALVLWFFLPLPVLPCLMPKHLALGKVMAILFLGAILCHQIWPGFLPGVAVSKTVRLPWSSQQEQLSVDIVGMYTDLDSACTCLGCSTSEWRSQVTSLASHTDQFVGFFVNHTLQQLEVNGADLPTKLPGISKSLSSLKTKINSITSAPYDPNPEIMAKVLSFLIWFMTAFITLWQICRLDKFWDKFRPKPTASPSLYAPLGDNEPKKKLVEWPISLSLRREPKWCAWPNEDDDTNENENADTVKDGICLALAIFNLVVVCWLAHLQMFFKPKSPSWPQQQVHFNSTIGGIIDTVNVASASACGGGNATMVTCKDNFEILAAQVTALVDFIVKRTFLHKA